ncbi:hypothetical protein LCGC14_1067850 [marine sediment metagenome]|uniref:Uncharacterized protein n=1 Tax=marine sediment metagenome TaxID=412755 RepID=A0A0F9MP19_9ZZZZ
MGMASPHDLHPDWYDGPNYTVIVALSPLNCDVHFDGQGMVGPSWDFENSDIHNWLEENYKGKFNYNWGIELEDDRMLIYVRFAKEEIVKDFKEKFETFDWNIECEEGRILINVHQLFYPSEGYNDDDFYEKITEAIQWCRENLQSLWKYHHHGQTGMFFYFRCENDAAAFKLRFL